MLNLRARQNVVGAVSDLVSNRIKAFGRRLGIRRGNSTSVNPHVERETIALDYENGTLNLNLMRNRQTGDESVSGFYVA